ncbi:MAG: acyltransferase family protein [Trueperaceae bacterium]
MSSPSSSSRPDKHLYELDLFRFIAAFLIVLHHYLFRGQTANGYNPVSFAPWLTLLGQYATGFNFFFMISGFVLIASSFRKTPAQFAISRAQRLYPAFWVCCTITYVVSLLSQDPRFMVSPLDYLANLTMLNGFVGIPYVDGAYWTMLVSIKFTLLLFFIILFRQTKHVYWLAWGWLLYSVSMIFLEIPYVDFFLLSNFAPFFIAGMMVYFIRTKEHRLKYWLLFASSYPVAMYYVMLDAQAKELRYEVSYSILTFMLIHTVYYLIFVLVATDKTKALRLPFFAFLGAITYPLFLLHQNIGFMSFTYINMNKYLLLFLLLVTMFSVAYLVYRFVEKPLTKPLGQWLEQRFSKSRKVLDRKPST